MIPKYEMQRSYSDDMLDITGAKDVEVVFGAKTPSGRVLWVNIDGVCVLRICRIKGKLTGDETYG